MADEKKKATKAHMEATKRYEKENYDKVLIRFPKGTKDRIKDLGESVNGFTVKAVLEKLEQLEGVE